MSDYAMLVDGEIIPTDDLRAWALWFEDIEARRVALTRLPNGKEVSTVFLGVNHAFGHGEPRWFETMIWDAKTTSFDDYQERYATLEQAMRGHDRAVALVRED